MIEEITRPLTHSERAAFSGQTGVQSLGVRIAKVLLITASLSGALSALMLELGPRLNGQSQARALIFFFALSGVIAVFVDRKTFCPRKSRRYLREIRSNIGTVHIYNATEAIRVPEFEDNGYAFLLRVDGGKTLYLSGQYLYTVTDANLFPNSIVRVTYAPESKFVLGLQCIGTYIKPVGLLSLKAAQTIWSRAKDGEILPIDFESLKRDTQEESGASK